MHHTPIDQKPLAREGVFNVKYTVVIAAIAALGGLLFGYDWVVIGGAKPFYEAYFHLTTAQQVGWANSCALLGCLLGSLAAGLSGDRFGRKRLLVAAAVLFAISSVLTGLAFSFFAFVFWRIVGGVAIGIASNVSPTYIAEISPAPWRGRLVSLNQVTIVGGILLAQVMNWLIADRVPEAATAQFIRDSWNGQIGWRYMFLAVAVPSALFFISAIFVPESPRWLVSRGREKQALAVFLRIGTPNYALTAVRDIKDALADEIEKESMWRGFGLHALRPVLLIGVVLAVLQQWSGINVLFNYAEEIYRAAGYGVNDVLFNIVITGAINVAFTLVAFGVVDRWGRRRLMLLGCAGIALSHLFLGTSYRLGLKGLPVLLLTLMTIGCYAMSLAPVTWVIISEIFPTRIRGTGVAISVSTLWIAAFLLTFSFPILNEGLGQAGTFWLYSGICAAGFLFIYSFVPETKGKTLEQIEREIVKAG